MRLTKISILVDLLKPTPMHIHEMTPESVIISPHPHPTSKLTMHGAYRFNAMDCFRIVRIF